MLDDGGAKIVQIVWRHLWITPKFSERRLLESFWAYIKSDYTNQLIILFGSLFVLFWHNVTGNTIGEWFYSIE